MSIMAIDPSTHYLGYAIGNVAPFEVIACGVLRPTTNEDYVRRSEDMYEKLAAIAYDEHVYDIVIEQPETWGTPKGISASTSGATLKLAFLVGYLYGRFQCWGSQLDRLPTVSLARVSEWKGQIPKKVMLRRMQASGIGLDLKATAKDLNASDALGLLLWHVKQLGYSV